MQDSVYELPRIYLLGSRVNRGAGILESLRMVAMCIMNICAVHTLVSVGHSAYTEPQKTSKHMSSGRRQWLLDPIALRVSTNGIT
jgi:hypothetical protein